MVYGGMPVCAAVRVLQCVPVWRCVCVAVCAWVSLVIALFEYRDRSATIQTA